MKRSKKIDVRKWLYISAILIGLPRLGLAQTQQDSTKKPNDWVLGLAMTATGYYGDLNYQADGILQSDFYSLYPGFALSFRSGAPRRLNLQFELGYGKIVSQNPNLEATVINRGDGFPPLVIQPNRYTETAMVHNNLGFRINLVKQAKVMKPFLGIGFGMLIFFPQSETGIPLVRKVSTRAPGEEIYNTITYQLPLTAGVEFNLDERIGLNLAYTYRATGTDYLDNIGQLGALEGNDRLHVIQIGASLHFIDRPERERPVRIRRNRADSHPLFSHQLEDPLPTETPNPTRLLRGIKHAEAAKAADIYAAEQAENCDSLATTLAALQLELETEKIKKEAEAVAWKSQSYELLDQMVENQKALDSLALEQDQLKQLGVENESLKLQLESLKNGSEDYADQLSFEAMKAENGYLIQEVERLKQELELAKKQKQIPTQVNAVETDVLIQKNDWLARELAKARKLLVSKDKVVKVDTLRMVDSLLLSGQKEGIFLDISGYRIALIVKGNNPTEKIRQYMNSIGYRGYTEDGNLIYDYVKVDEIGKTTYRLFFAVEAAEEGIYQFTAFFQPEIGRVSVSRYMTESRKAREWIVGIMK